MSIRISLISFAIAVALSTGCSRREAAIDPGAAEKRERLREVYNLMTVYTEQKNRPPTAEQNLRPFENAFPNGFRAIRSGQVVVLWGAAPAADSDAVLAYDKAVPTEGGWVLLTNGKAKEMTPDEFGVAPKAGKVGG